MRTIALCLALLSGSARAELLLSVNGLEMRLQGSQCTDTAVLAHIADQFHPRFQKAAVTLHGQPQPACWIDEGDSIFIYFADGSGGRLDRRVFKDSPGA